MIEMVKNIHLLNSTKFFALILEVNQYLGVYQNVPQLTNLNLFKKCSNSESSLSRS